MSDGHSFSMMLMGTVFFAVAGAIVIAVLSETVAFRRWLKHHRRPRREQKPAVEFGRSRLYIDG